MATNLKQRKPPSQRAVTTGDAAKAGVGGDGRALKPGDNRRAMLEAEEAQMLSVISKLRALQIPIDEAKATLAEAKAQYDEVVRLAGIAGFKKYELKELLDDLGAKRRDLSEQEERRARFRTYLGLPSGISETQQDMNIPETARDEIFWEGDGYTCGVRGTDPVPPVEAGVHGQAWMKGYHNGQKRNAWAASASKVEPAPPVPPEEKEPTRAELKAQERRAKESLENLPPAAPDNDVESTPETPPGADGFEATPEELSAQITRQVIVETREGDAEEVVG